MRLVLVVFFATLTLTACREAADETDPVFGASSAANVSADKIAAWDRAAGWGNHRDAGYLLAADFATTPAAAITTTQVTSWDEAFTWGDHATAGYATQAELANYATLASLSTYATQAELSNYVTQTALAALPATSIAAADITRWETAAAWGNHATAGYLTTTAFSATAASTITTTDVTEWDTAYGWGNHATAGYLRTTTFNATPASGITAQQVTNWNGVVSKFGTLTTDALPRWNGTALVDNVLVQKGTNLGVGTTAPQGALSVGTVAHLGKNVPTNTSKSCGMAGFAWTNTPPSAASCTAYCTARSYATGVVSTQGAKASCGGASCDYVSDFETCTVTSMQNNGNCDSCGANFVCTCLTPASVFEAEVKVNAYLQLGNTAGSPPAADCDATNERGRMKIDPATNLMWICGNSGWTSK